MATHYDGGNVMFIRRTNSLKRLDAFGLSLANKHVVWTLRERREFEKRVRELKGRR